MDIHEYQAKQLLSKFGISIPPGEVVYQTHEAENILSWLNAVSYTHLTLPTNPEV